MTDIRTWPRYDARTGRAQPATPPPLYSRPETPMQPCVPPREPDLRRTVAENVCWWLGVLLASAIVLLVLTAFVLGLRDIFRFIFGGIS